MGVEVADGQPMAAGCCDAAGARRLPWGRPPMNERRELWDEIEAQQREEVGYKRERDDEIAKKMKNMSVRDGWKQERYDHIANKLKRMSVKDCWKQQRYDYIANKMKSMSDQGWLEAGTL